jgi:hypothetical protein
MSPQRKTLLVIAVLGLVVLSVQMDLAQAQMRVYGYNGAASRYSLMPTASRSGGYLNGGYLNRGSPSQARLQDWFLDHTAEGGFSRNKGPAYRANDRLRNAGPRSRVGRNDGHLQQLDPGTRGFVGRNDGYVQPSAQPTETLNSVIGGSRIRF